jgi:hypothetical protein
MKAYGGMETELHAFFTLTLGGVSGLLYTPVASHKEKTLFWYTLEWASMLDWMSKVLPLLGIEPQFLSCPACSLVAVAHTVAN